MHSNAKCGHVANLFTNFRSSGYTSRHFSSLQAEFQNFISDKASKFPVFWLDDFIQEGNIGLHNAALKYPKDADPSKFYFYALKAIQTKMLDFYQSVIGRTMSDVVDFDIEGRAITCKQSIFQDIYKYNSEGEEVYNLLDEIASPTDFVSSTTLAIDFKYCLSNQAMKKSGLTDQEIKVFDYHFNKGCNVSEVAAKIKLSISQTSKIIYRTKTKVQQLLAYTINNSFN
jgi:RNA polymerase sigma factor (sigma-70 family)